MVVRIRHDDCALLKTEVFDEDSSNVVDKYLEAAFLMWACGASRTLCDPGYFFCAAQTSDIKLTLWVTALDQGTWLTWVSITHAHITKWRPFYRPIELQLVSWLHTTPKSGIISRGIITNEGLCLSHTQTVSLIGKMPMSQYCPLYFTSSFASLILRCKSVSRKL